MATIEINGKVFEAENGKTIIEVADEVGIPIPRFCYHKKLSVAANCRMCLVEVENVRKPVPACATPITNGMKVFTQSDAALHSQKAVMEFLLINHPLDCPICDQGGECELQDVSMGFGHSDSEYSETKRAVEDQSLGTLIATEMTRCIHCTRCVRFGEEISGVRELGATGRGEDMQIGTYIAHSMTSEVSGNVIDLCPVGALTSKPYRFSARPWELAQSNAVAPHDCLGSNVHVHLRRETLMRVVPRENEALNETWLSDRDRFSYLGMNSAQRAASPKIKKDGKWETVDWSTALNFAAEGMAKIIKQYGPEQWAAFASASATVEEHFILQRLMRALGVQSLDHRLQQSDFRDQATLPMHAMSTMPYAALDKKRHVLLLGTNLAREVPLASTRLYKAYRNGATIHAINPVAYQTAFQVAAQQIVSPQHMPMILARIALALKGTQTLPAELEGLFLGVEVDEVSQAMALALQQGDAAIVTGALFENHPDAAWMRTLLHYITTWSGVDVLRLTSGANSAGASLAGMLPHREAAGKMVESPGLSVQEAIEARLRGYFLLGVEPGYDFSNPAAARQALLGADFVVMLSAFDDPSHADYANVLLPIAPYMETSGTYVNVDGAWQTVQGVKKPHAEARPAWKILRVLANLLHCPHFEYESSADILKEVRHLVNIAQETPYTPFFPEVMPSARALYQRVGEWPLYASDAIVRHSIALQNCGASERACVRVHPQTADQLNLEDYATVSQGDIGVRLPLVRDAAVAKEVVWVANGMFETMDLGHAFAEITIKS
ncbi:MAG: NADH-quinone oxidoreductase subunit NuoG [Legionellaceae bacterium]|nr:NADH-quinone oxidoreductase subunit NuoG [Legionellaceae bacterium]